MSDSMNIKKSERLYYVEPNDPEGRINGIPVTPDYTDYCISFDLIVEVVSRFSDSNTVMGKGVWTDTDASDNKIENGGDIAVLTWVSDPKSVSDGVNQVSFLRGEEASKYTYLSTYYTDLDFERVRKENIVEGLGITNVSVMFQSYYVPQVKLKMVDVRGASLFGREEAVHSKSGITADTVYGCFFTCPYPKFRMQIKGFYGQAVTYQLTCLDFRGSFNSNTGNYEVDVTLIGYDYSLLNDIPMSYIMAAPYCSYIGRSYWNEHVNSDPDWALSDGSRPVRFGDFYKKLDGLTGFTFSDDEEDEGASQADYGYSDREIAFTKLSDAYTAFIDSTRDGRAYVNFTHKDHLVTVSEYPAGYERKICKLYNDLITSVEEYKTLYPGSALDAVTGDSFFSGSMDLIDLDGEGIPWNEDRYTSTYNEIKSFGNLAVGAKSVSIPVFLSSGAATTSVSVDAKRLSEIVNDDQPGNTYELTLYDIGNLYDVISEENENLNMLDRTTQAYQRANRKKQERQMRKFFGFLPTLGDFFHVLLCHFETFMAMLYGCDELVKRECAAGIRTKSKLGIRNLSDTDIVLNRNKNDENINIPTFPGILVTRPKGSDMTGQTQIGWCGDYVGETKWQEQMLVESIISGITYNDNNKDITVSWGESVLDTPDVVSTTKPMAVLPCDLISGVPNPDFLTSQNLASDLSGYLGNRAVECAYSLQRDTGVSLSEYGKVDAANMLLQSPNPEQLAESIIKSFGNTGMAGDIEARLKADTDECETFEHYSNLLVNKGNAKRLYRQPVIGEDGNYEVYTYTNTANGSPLVSVDFDTEVYSLAPGMTYYGSEDGSYFKPTLKPVKIGTHTWYTTENIICPESSDLFVEATDRYVNESMFGIVKYDTTSAKLLSVGKATVSGRAIDIPESADIKDRTWRHMNRPEDGMPPFDNLSLIDGSDATPYSFIKNNKWVNEVSGKTAMFSELKIFPNTPSPVGFPMFYDNRNIPSGGAGGYTEGEMVKYRKASLILRWLYPRATDNGYEIEQTSLNRSNMSYVDCMYDAHIAAVGGVCWNYMMSSLLNLSDPVLSYAESDEEREMLEGDYTSELKTDWYDALDSMEANRLVAFFIEYVDKYWERISSNFEVYMGDRAPLDYDTFMLYTGGLLEDEDVKGYIDSDLNRKYSLMGDNVLLTLGGELDTSNGSSTCTVLFYINPFNEGQQEYLHLTTRELSMICSTAVSRIGGSYIKPGSIRDYLEGFAEVIEAYHYGADPAAVSTSPDIPAQREYEDRIAVNANYAQLVEVYKFVKNYWERWGLSNRGIFAKVCYSDSDRRGVVEKDVVWYKVGAFSKNFIFIDAFYSNTYKRFHLNCSLLKKAFDAVRKESIRTLLSFIGDVTNQHHCQFMCYPDYLEMGTRDEDTAILTMENLFTAYPFSKKANIQSFNKYVIMYQYDISHVPSETTAYAYDGFDLWDGADDDANILPTFKTIKYEDEYRNASDHERTVNRYGYNVPSFGVAAGRQNNAIFKAINVSMTNPLVTEQVINSLSIMASENWGKERQINFYGQDLFPIYSGYSYTCELVMMGNAQITPMMFFQLMNIPMFRGTYLIYQVTHNMVPGDMTTTVKAMKMSKYAYPYCEGWYTDSSEIYFDNEGKASTGEYVDEKTGGDLTEYVQVKESDVREFDEDEPFIVAETSPATLKFNMTKAVGKLISGVLRNKRKLDENGEFEKKDAGTSVRRCASYVCDAIDAGFIGGNNEGFTRIRRAEQAYADAQILPTYGFEILEVVDPSTFEWQKGDVVIFNRHMGNDGEYHKDGHMMMFYNNKWYSDYVTTSFSPWGENNYGDFCAFRYPSEFIVNM